MVLHLIWYISLLAVGLLLLVATGIMSAVFETMSALALLVCSAIFLALIFHKLTKISAASVFARAPKIELFLWLLIFFYVIFLVFMQTQLPLIGWDAVNHWAPKALEILRAYQLGAQLEDYHRHGPLVSSIFAVPLIVNYEFGVNLPSGSPWLVFMITGAVSSSVFCRAVTGNSVASSLSALLFLSTPLMQNHFLLYGYSELLLGVALMIALTLYAEWDAHGHQINIFTCLLIIIISLSIRNTSAFYIASLAAAFFLVSGGRQRYRLSALLLLGCIGLLILTPSFHIDRFGVLLALDRSEDVLFVFGKRLQILPIDLALLKAIVDNQYHALFKNASFSVLFLCLCLYLCARATYSKENSNNVLNVAATAVFVMLLGLSFSQITDHGMYHAIAENDTGNSRFIVPVACVLSMLVIPIALAWHPYSPENSPSNTS